MKVDIDALATWILEKANKQHGVPLNDSHVRFAVTAAVTDAVRQEGDELHVTCKIGDVTIDERMSRTAAENLFAPAPPHVDPPPRKHEPARAPPRDNKESEPDPRIFGINPNLFVICVMLVVSLLILAVTVAELHHEHGAEERKDEKHEMHR